MVCLRGMRAEKFNPGLELTAAATEPTLEADAGGFEFSSEGAEPFLGRVSEWLAASLEMRCPVWGCGFESRALRSGQHAGVGPVDPRILGPGVLRFPELF